MLTSAGSGASVRRRSAILDGGAAARTEEPATRPDAALGLPPAALHAGVPREARRQLQRQVPRLRAADGDDLRPGRDQGPLHGARPRPAARPRGLPRADPRLALAAAARRSRPPRPPQADAARLPRRADALLRADHGGDRRRRDRLLAAGRGVRGPPAHAGDHAGRDPARRLRRRRGAAAGAAPPPAHRRAGGDRLALHPADRPWRRGASPAAGRGPSSRDSCGRSTSCSTRRSPSAAPRKASRSATTSSRS